MTTRKFYPAPACPKCGKQGPQCSKVKNTAYLEGDIIIRHRECQFCGFKWWTKQTPEANIEPDKEILVIPDFKNNPGNKKRIYTLTKVT